MSNPSAARGTAAASSLRLTLRTSNAVATSNASPSRCFLFCEGSRAARSARTAAATVSTPPIPKAPPHQRRRPPITSLSQAQEFLMGGEPCGVGKSWLACALGHKACREDLSVLYYRVPRLFTALVLARGDGRYGKLLRQLARANLLILDDWGPEPLLPEQARDLLEIVEDRYDAGSLLITSQVPVDRWYDMIGIPTLADAVLDRVVHNAYRIELSGESLRKRKAPEPAAA